MAENRDFIAALGGKFIVLDGPEGCGKSTQARLLAQSLEAAGVSAIVVRDPGTTAIGERVRAILLDPASREMGMRCEMLLYMAARAQMMAEIILPALQAGKTVVCDRFVSSTLAYQLGGDGITAAEIRDIAEVAIRGRWPDLTIILDMPAERSMARVQREKDRIEQRPATYHEQVRQNYLAQAKADLHRYRVLLADRKIEDVQTEIWKTVTEMMRSQSSC